MQPTCDLHTHSVFSDGTDTPAQIIDAAVALGLTAVALCDHNTADGLPDFLLAAAGKPIQAICGAEFSVDYNGTELHLLGLYLPPTSFAPIRAHMAEAARHKEQSNLALIDALARAGYPLDYAAIKASTPKGRVNRAHIAAALTNAGFTASTVEAFATLLKPTAGYYVPPRRISFWEMLDMIRLLGGVPVLAHPLLNLDPQTLADLLPEAHRHGLVGMECRYSTYTPAQTAICLELAQANGLLPSGGSDYHGRKKPDIRLGSGRGDLAVPAAWAEALTSAPRGWQIE